jgi:hypothetical protein
MRARPSLRAKRSNPSRRTKKGWIASSLTLLAMTGPDTSARSFETVIASQRVARMRARPSLRANGSRECAPDDRLREAIQSRKKGWIASSLTLLAMTGPDTGARSFETVIASEAKQSRAARKNGLLRR